MYFANSAGLLEYDGSQWTLYPLSKNSSNVRSIAITEDQRIYTGVRNEFGYWSENIATRKLKYTSLTKASNLHFADEEIWKIVPFRNSVYFHSFRNIYKYNTQTKSISIIPAPNRFQFLFRANDRLFAQEKVLGLMEIKEDKLIGVPGGELFTGDCVYGIEPYSSNSVLIATIDRGLYMMENGRISQCTFPCNDFLIKNQIFSMLMKTKFFLLIGLLVFAGVVWGQNEDRQSKVAAKEAKVKKTVDSGQFQVVMNQAHPMKRSPTASTTKYIVV